MTLLHWAEKARSLRGWRGNLLTLGLGGLAVFGHAPFYLWPLLILCFAGFVWRLDGSARTSRPLKSAFWQGWLFGFGYFIVSLYWVGSAFIARGGGFVYMIPFAVPALVALLALFWAVAGLAYVRLAGKGPARGVLFAVLFTLAELGRGYLFTGFPWNLPGYIFEGGGAVSQAASLFGVYGLTFVVLLLAGGLAVIFDNVPARRRFGSLAVSAALLAAAFIFGWQRLPNGAVETVPGVKIRTIQAAIPQAEKNDYTQREAIIEHYIGLTTAEPLDGITHVVWPEAAIPTPMLRDQYLLDRLDETLRGGPVLLTGFNRDAGRWGVDYQAWNSFGAFQFTPSGEMIYSARYDKAKLVPFGEFMPGGKTVSSIIPSLSTQAFSLTPGESAQTLAIPGAPNASPQICYEIVFPGFTPDGRSRPEWIINVSNDSWYGNSPGPRQHFNQVRYRAIEEGLPVVRSASSGYSGILDPFGRDVIVVGLDADRAVDGPLPKALAPTFYAKWRDFPVFFLVLGLLSLLVLSPKTRLTG